MQIKYLALIFLFGLINVSLALPVKKQPVEKKKDDAKEEEVNVNLQVNICILQ